jgi:hypothetical protein
LRGIGEENLPLFSDEQIAFANYLSGLLPLVRPHEYAIVRCLLNGINDVNIVSHTLKEKIANYNDAELSHALKFMKFVSQNSAVLELDVSIDDQFNEYLDDLLQYGLTRYSVDLGDEPEFKLWQTYRMDQVQLKLLKNPGFNQVGTYYYDDFAVIFASLKKDASVEERLNYKDKFLQSDLFQWESMAHLPASDLAKLNKIRFAHLFIRKVSMENGIVLPFTYVGKGNLSNCRKTDTGNGTYLFDIGMENELPDYLQYDFGLTK